MEKFDCIIVGAGVVGLAMAKDLAIDGRSVLLIERHDSFGQETSSRNSEVIHGGMYYPTGSLKAVLCVEGRRLLYDFCSSCKIPFKKTGKIIVATDRQEIPAFEKLFQLGLANGVEGLRLIAKEEIKSLEPHVSGVAALYSPETGIIDSHRLMSCLADSAKESGAIIAYDSEFLRAAKEKENYKIFIKNGIDELSLTARIVINSAGLDSDIVAENAGFDLEKYHYSIHYCKGQYFRLSSAKARLLKMLVYPVPKPASGGLGVHATVDLAGGVRLGPDDEYLKLRVQDYSVDPLRRLNFYDSASKFIPFIFEDDLSVDTAGIRPKLQEPEGDFRDFVISDETDKGFPGFINLIGIESPGLTASLAISRYVKGMVSKYY
ncbi:MAG: NAD(P)/FAD-dependent oxidoreductase [Candidatus Omnitrophica bacterium]|nr:NAD(P)/FAD-dependent oxidoreductase [Candidatus Omnitrophota bacterium]